MARTISLDQDPLPHILKSPSLEVMRKLAQVHLDRICNQGGEDVLKSLERARIFFSKTIQEAAGLMELLRHFRQSVPAEHGAGERRVKITDSVRQILRAMQYESSFRGLTVLKILPHDLPDPPVPRDIFEMILFQLLAQARRAIGEQSGIMTVEAQERVVLSRENYSRYMIILRVSDTGPRIVEGEFESLFDPLAPGTGPGTGKRGGFGLYAAKKLAEGHAGRLRVETSERGTSLYADFSG